ncbi:uncharacterized protein LOC127104733 [Lathyrus oleraceus]|uniref:uncharacterized protein LOC127104733 n=1 Tax=Pisum sativum TaxID=3888 RepID=UPI0021D1D553|nr:uncharacterized protein LOC127104733 [Pisum sativum]
MGTTHSFFSLECAERLGLKLSYMVGSMIVDTPTLDSVTTLWVFLNCPLTSYSRNFGMDLVCLPLRNLDVILEMNWLEFNLVHINWYDKTVSFPEFDASDELFVSPKQVDWVLKVFMILDFMKAQNEAMIGELTVVCEFPEVFLNDISDFLSEHEVEFSIELLLGTSPVLMILIGCMI